MYQGIKAMKSRVWQQEDFVVDEEPPDEFGKESDLSSMPCEADFHLTVCFTHTTNNLMQRTVLHVGNSAPVTSPSKTDSL